MPRRAGGRPHRVPLPPRHGAVLAPRGLRFTRCQPQRCQHHLWAGRGQGWGRRGVRGAALAPCCPPGRTHTPGYRSQSRARYGCPGAARVCGPAAGNAPRQPLRRPFPAVPQQAASCRCRGGRRARCPPSTSPCPPSGAPRALCKRCRRGGWGAGPGGSAAGPPPCRLGRCCCPRDGQPGGCRQTGGGGLRLPALAFLAFISLEEEAISSPRGSRARLTLSPMLSRLVRASLTRSPLPPRGAGCCAPGSPAPRTAPAGHPPPRGEQGPEGPGRAAAPAARAGSQGIPRRGLDFPAAMAPITAAESFSIKPAVGLETAPGPPRLRGAAGTSGRPPRPRLPAAALSHRRGTAFPRRGPARHRAAAPGLPRHRHRVPRRSPSHRLPGGGQSHRPLPARNAAPVRPCTGTTPAHPWDGPRQPPPPVPGGSVLPAAPWLSPRFPQLRRGRARRLRGRAVPGGPCGRTRCPHGSARCRRDRATLQALRRCRPQSQAFSRGVGVFSAPLARPPLLLPVSPCGHGPGAPRNRCQGGRGTPAPPHSPKPPPGSSASSLRPMWLGHAGAARGAGRRAQWGVGGAAQRPGRVPRHPIAPPAARDAW